MISRDSKLWNVKFIDEYIAALRRRRMPQNECCICGSSTLAIYGMRKNNDIDFVCTPELARVKNFKVDHTYFFTEGKRVALIPMVPPYFSSTANRMRFMPYHFVLIDGVRVASLEDCYLSKCAWIFHNMSQNNASPKNASDIDMLNQYFDANGFNDSVIPPDIWDGGENWKIGSVTVRLPSPYRLKAYNPIEGQENREYGNQVERGAQVACMSHRGD